MRARILAFLRRILRPRPPEERRAVRYEDEPWRDSRLDDLVDGAKR